MIIIEEKLTKEQLKAVRIINKPLIIVAGPGSGKTKVLTHKAAYLIKDLGLKPHEIIMTTFTVKAAEEMRSRISSMIKEDISNMFIGTIHSLCDSIIKEFGKERYVDYEVLDEFKRYIFIRKYKKELGINEKITNLLCGFGDDTVSLVMRFYDILAENYIIGDKLNRFRNEIKEKMKRKAMAKSRSIIHTNEEIEKAIFDLIDSYEKYVKLLEDHKFMDFSLMEVNAYELLQDERIAKLVKEKIKYIMIDEFQDINPIQWNIIKKIAKKDNITVVGDKNQSIYAFRGANPNIFDIFEKDFPDAKKLYLKTNFRSKKDIVELSNRFLNKVGRKEIRLTANRKKRCKIWLMKSDNEYEEARSILNLVEKLKKTGRIRRYGEVAILAKSVRYHLKALLRLLDEEYVHIPYEVYAGSSMFLDPEIRSIIFFIAYVLGIENNEIIRSFPIIPKRDEDFPEINTMSKILGTYMFGEEKEPKDVNWTAFDDPERLSKKSGLKLENADIVVKLNKLREKVEERPKKIDILELMYEIVGILGLTSKDDEKSIRWLKTIGKLSKLMVHYTSIYGNLDSKSYIKFLKILRLMPENLNIDRDNEGIEIIDNESLVISTVHQAKGLEFPVVIIPSLINKRFPSNRRNNYLIPKELYWYEPYPREKEEENIFFVAITRAQDELILSTFSRTEKRSTKMSKFIENVMDMLDKFTKDSVDKMEIINRSISEDRNFLINYSAVSTFIDCPERFKYNYLYGMKTETIFEQKIGTIYHNAIAKINQSIRDGDHLTDDYIKKIIDESWLDLGDKNEIFKKKVKKSLKRYINFAKSYIRKIMYIEKPVNIIIDNLMIKGRADLVVENKKGETVLIDFKSRKSKSIKETHVDIQLMMYARSLETDGIKIDKLVTYPIEDERIDLRKITITKKDKLIDNILNQFKKCITNNKFPMTKNGSSFCKKCPYKHFCKYINKSVRKNVKRSK